MRAMLLLVLALGVAGSCSQYPQYGYYELDDAIARAETEEEREYHRKRLERIERMVLEADKFLMALKYCSSDPGCVVWCDGRAGARDLDLDRREFDDIDDLVRWYRNVRPPTCNFVKNGL